MKLKSRRARSSRTQSSIAKPLNRNRFAVAAVEFAIVAPFLLLLVFMMIEASRFLTSLNVTAGAAREVARLVAVGDVEPNDGRKLCKDRNGG